MCYQELALLEMKLRKPVTIKISAYYHEKL